MCSCFSRSSWRWHTFRSLYFPSGPAKTRIPLKGGGIGAVSRSATSVAVEYRLEALQTKSGTQPADLAGADSQQHRRATGSHFGAC